MTDESRHEEKMMSREADLSGLPEKEEEMLPKGAEQVAPPSTGGEAPDTAGEYGEMAPEAARGLDGGAA